MSTRNLSLVLQKAVAAHIACGRSSCKGHIGQIRVYKQGPKISRQKQNEIECQNARRTPLGTCFTFTQVICEITNHFPLGDHKLEARLQDSLDLGRH